MLIDGLNFTDPKDPLTDILGSKEFIKNIDSADNMFGAKSTDQSYYWVGKTALDSIRAAMNASSTPPPAGYNSILDFPSGYGRALRFLRYAYPTANITACDIDKAAVDFCVAEFSATPIYSSMDVKQVDLKTKYDLIWVGSLFTHLTEEAACDLLSLFYGSLTPGGLLVFTIAGEYVYDQTISGAHLGLPKESISDIKVNFEKTGFAFGRYQRAVTESNYGRAFIHRNWLQNKIIDYPALEEVAYINRGYARRQDVIAWRMNE